MLVYRVSSPQYAGDITGTGAKLYGGRWNEKGTAVVYFASSRAMALMELLVHLRPQDLDRNYAIAVFEVPDNKIYKVSLELLPTDWKSDENKPALAKLCKRFIDEGKYLLMEVPSVLVEEESNYVLNPSHTDAARIKLISQRPFSFDHRLKK